ncbi:MAG: Nif3-like dinuclear metal center hexameric protein [Deltaproteobacteria bacterium]|nr:Nif3-like dinuclear metal center hexameric protein [Deltaproteobacteria bacterium]
MKISSLVSLLEDYFPSELALKNDNPGLQVGNLNSEIKGILISLDIYLSTIDEAKKKNCNLIISHHPLLFFSTKKINTSIYPYNAVQRAIQNDITLYAIHTNADIADGGLNDYLCKILNVQHVEKMSPDNLIRCGKLPRPMKLIELCEHIGEKLHVPHIKYVGEENEYVKDVAVCSGSCGDVLWNLSREFDVFITGDIKHHTAIYAKERGIKLIDATHFSTELIFKDLLDEILKKHIRNIPVLKSECDSLPWKYFIKGGSVE